MSLLRPHPCRLPIRTSHRAFSITTSRPVSLQLDRNDPDAVADTVPAYPHGPARWYKQSNKGLYGGQRIQFGNNVSGDFNTKTRRTFQVNVLTKRLWSHALNRFVQVRVTARTLRTIDRVGGLDEYLLGDKEARIKQLGMSGWWLRWAIMQQPSIKKRFQEERRSLGLEPEAMDEAKLQDLEAGNVGAELEEAYAALPEEGEVEAAAAVEEMPETSEQEAAIETDGSDESTITSLFGVSDASNQPPLKFRVDRRMHVVLTPQGWKRTRPNSPEYSKKWIAEHRYANYVAKRMAIFEAELEALKAKEMPEMTLGEEKAILNEARRKFTKELNDAVDVEYESQRVGVDEKRENRARAQRRQEAGEKRRARRAEKESAAEREPDAFDLPAAPQTA